MSSNRPHPAPRVAALILAAGRGSRMGRNKLLLPVAGKPMLRHAAEAALASRADPVLVVTGNESEKVRAALPPLPLTFLENRDFPKGLSSSLKLGVKGVPASCQGVLVLLGDMPGVDAALLDRLIAAFDPEGGAAIVVPAKDGRHGNPVLWSRAFFPEMAALEGDRGAQVLLHRHKDQIREVEVTGEAAFTDLDTETELAAYRPLDFVAVPDGKPFHTFPGTAPLDFVAVPDGKPLHTSPGTASMSDTLYRKELLRLAADAVGAGRLPHPDASASRHNPACGDRVTVELALRDGRITALAHRTQACVLAQASAAILGAHAAGLNRADAGALMEAVTAMLKGGKAPAAPFADYAAFDGAADFAGRHRCVLLPLEAMLAALEAAKPGG